MENSEEMDSKSRIYGRWDDDEHVRFLSGIFCLII